jgi:hypothetical protein
MAKKKHATLKKPVLTSEAVLGFAEGRGSPASSRARSSKASAAVVDPASTSRFPPTGDIRLTVNIREDLHMRLKMEAVKRRTTVGEILEDLVQQHIKA